MKIELVDQQITIGMDNFAVKMSFRSPKISCCISETLYFSLKTKRITQRPRMSVTKYLMDGVTELPAYYRIRFQWQIRSVFPEYLSAFGLECCYQYSPDMFLFDRPFNNVDCFADACILKQKRQSNKSQKKKDKKKILTKTYNVFFKVVT